MGARALKIESATRFWMAGTLAPGRKLLFKKVLGQKKSESANLPMCMVGVVEFRAAAQKITPARESPIVQPGAAGDRSGR